MGSKSLRLDDKKCDGPSAFFLFLMELWPISFLFVSDGAGGSGKAANMIRSYLSEKDKAGL